VVTAETPVYGPDELADRAGVSRRTVRYYVQRGLLPAPAGLGRGKHYGASHLARLLQIRELQAAGVPLEEIADRLDGRTPLAIEASAPSQSMWTRVTLAEGVELHLEGRRLTGEQVRKLSQLVKRTIGVEEP
jgi:DNA-binding transcriptional MerR regulator